MVPHVKDRGKTPPPREDLVIIHYKGGSYEFNNRWVSSNHLIDYGSIKRWNHDLLQMNNTKLKRLKIYGLERKPIADLLEQLSGQLLQLEISTLELLEGSRTEYSFKALKIFVVDSIQVVDRQGQPAPEREMGPPRPSIKLNAKQLKTVHLGK